MKKAPYSTYEASPSPKSNQRGNENSKPLDDSDYHDVFSEPPSTPSRRHFGLKSPRSRAGVPGGMCQILTKL